MIDSHVHFFDPNRPEGLVWPPPESGFPESALPADLSAAAAGSELQGVIAVETSRRFEDDLWLLELAKREPLIRGVVLNLQPDVPDFDLRFAIAKRSKYFCGIRLRPIADYDLASSVLRESITRLSDSGHTVEFGAKSTEDKAAFAELACTFSQSKWILDHCGHPDFGARSLDTEWFESMKRISAFSNAFVKVTNPFGFAALLNGRDTKKSCESMMTALIDMFGYERLVFGSNWPDCGISASYSSVIKFLNACLSNDDHRDALFLRNAKYVYFQSLGATFLTERPPST